MKTARPSRRRDCHFADTPSPSTLKRLLKGEGVQQNDSLADGAGPPQPGLDIYSHSKGLGHGRLPMSCVHHLAYIAGTELRRIMPILCTSLVLCTLLVLLPILCTLLVMLPILCTLLILSYDGSWTCSDRPLLNICVGHLLPQPPQPPQPPHCSYTLQLAGPNVMTWLSTLLQRCRGFSRRVTTCTC